MLICSQMLEIKQLFKFCLVLKGHKTKTGLGTTVLEERGA